MMTAGERRKKQMNEEENAVRQQGMPVMGDSYNIVMQKAASAGTNKSSDSAGDEQMMHRDKLMGTLGNIRQQENDFTQYVDNALKSLGEQRNAQIGQAMEQGRLVVNIKPTTAMQYVDQNRAKSRTSYNQQSMQQTAMQKQQVAQAQVTLDRNVKGMQKQQVAQAQSGLDRNVQVMQQQEEQAHNRAQHLEAQRQAQREAAAARRAQSAKALEKQIDEDVKAMIIKAAKEQAAAGGHGPSQVSSKTIQSGVARSKVLQENKEEYIKKYGDAAYTTQVQYYSFKDACEGYSNGTCPGYETLTDLKNNYDEKIKEMGSEAYFKQWNEATKTIQIALADEAYKEIQNSYNTFKDTGLCTNMGVLNYLMENQDTYIKEKGQDEYFNTLKSFMQAVNTDLKGAFDIAQTIQQSGKNVYYVSELETLWGGISNELTYTNSDEDKVRKALGLVPEAFDTQLNDIADSISFKHSAEWNGEKMLELMAEKGLQDMWDAKYTQITGGTKHLSEQEKKSAEDQADVFVFKERQKLLLAEEEYAEFEKDWAEMEGTVYEKMEEYSAISANDALNGTMHFSQLDKTMAQGVEANIQAAIADYGEDYENVELMTGVLARDANETACIVHFNAATGEINALFDASGRPLNEIAVNDIVSEQMRLKSIGKEVDPDAIETLRNYGLEPIIEMIDNVQPGDDVSMTENAENTEAAIAKYGDDYKNVVLQTGDASNSGYLIRYNAATGMVNELFDETGRSIPVSVVNDIISEQMYLKYMGQGVDELAMQTLKDYGLDPIIEKIEATQQGDPITMTENARKSVEEDFYRNTDNLRYEEKNDEILAGYMSMLDRPEFIHSGQSTKSFTLETDQRPVMDGIVRDADGEEHLVKDDTQCLLTFLNSCPSAQTWIKTDEDNNTQQTMYQTFDVPEDQYGRFYVQYQLAFDDYKYATEEERDVLRGLYANGDEEGIAEYREVLERKLRTREQQMDDHYLRKLVEQDGPWGEILAGLKSVVNDMLAPITYIDTLIQGIKGERVDLTSTAQQFGRNASVYADMALSTIESEIGKFFAEAAISITKMAPKLATGPVGAMIWSGLSTAGTDAYSQSAMGKTPWEAVGHATAMGMVEALTEKLPLDDLFKLGRTGAKPFANFIKKTGQHMGLEFSEEMISSSVGNFLDVAIAGDDSQYVMRMRELMADGKTAEQAKHIATFETFIMDPIISGFQGATSGGVMGGSAIAVGNVRSWRAKRADGVTQKPKFSLKTTMDAIKTRFKDAKMFKSKSGFNLRNDVNIDDTRAKALDQGIREGIEAVESFSKATGIDIDITDAHNAYMDALQSDTTSQVDAYNKAVALTVQSIDTAINSKDITTEQRTQLENAAQRMIGSVDGMNTGVAGKTYLIQTVNKAISALQTLPEKLQQKINFDKSFESYLSDGFNEDGIISQESLIQINESINAALVSSELTAEQTAELQEVQLEIAKVIGDTVTADNSNDADGVVESSETNAKSVNDIPKPTKAEEFFPYMCEIGKRTDLNVQEKVQILQEAYYDLGDRNRKDITCPIDVKFLKKHGFNKDGYLEYDWPELLGFKPGSINPITRDSGLIRKWRRVGSLRGNNFSDAPAGKAYTNDDLSLPYIENPEAKREGTFRNDGLYFDVIDAISKGDIDALNALMMKNGFDRVTERELKHLRSRYINFCNDAKTQVGEDAIYGLQGIVAEWKDRITGEVYLKGGAAQITLPFSGEQLERLGILINK